MRSDFYPIVSIIIPAVRVDYELRRCIDSIRILDCFNYCEIVLVVPSICLLDARVMFPNEIIIEESFSNIYGAMNDGVTASSGRYLYFLGKDDIVLPTFCEALDILIKKMPDVLFCDVYWGGGGKYSGRPSRLKVLGKNLCHQGIIYSRDVMSKYGPYIRRMRVQADQFINIKILWDRSSNNNIIYLNKPLAWYSGVGFSSRTRDPLFWKLHPLILKKYVGVWAACLLKAYRVSVFFRNRP